MVLVGFMLWARVKPSPLKCFFSSKSLRFLLSVNRIEEVMGSENEPAKLLLPYLQRADELQKHEHLVAYYCRLYAMERGLNIPQNLRTKTTNAILVSLMNQLEKDKKSLKLGPEDNLYVEGFASNVFAKADKQDRAGRADLNTAKTFYAASIFFEILNQFGELQPDLEQKQKYAAWKAADIRKALKEGQKPVPGPPGGDKDDMSNTGYDLEPSQDIPGFHNGSVAQDLPPQFHDRSNYQSSTDLPASPPSYATSQNLPRHGSGAEDLPPQFHDRSNYQSSMDVPAPPSYPTSQNFPGSHHGSGAEDLPPRFHDKGNYQSSTDLPTPSSYPANDYPPRLSYPTNGPLQNMPLPPPAYPSSDYSADDFNSLPSPPNISPNSAYPHQYHHPMHPQEPQHPPPQNYPSHKAPSPSYTLPNFQSYPGFADHSVPAVPTGHPSFYQGLEVSYPQQSTPPVSRQPSTVKYNSTSRVESNAKPASTSSQTFHYDSNYTPPPDKIAEAHKAARFAVGALAFDDVVVAVDFLRKSLELLTNPSVSQ